MARRQRIIDPQDQLTANLHRLLRSMLDYYQPGDESSPPKIRADFHLVDKSLTLWVVVPPDLPSTQAIPAMLRILSQTLEFHKLTPASSGRQGPAINFNPATEDNPAKIYMRLVYSVKGSLYPITLQYVREFIRAALRVQTLGGQVTAASFESQLPSAQEHVVFMDQGLTIPGPAINQPAQLRPPFQQACFHQHEQINPMSFSQPHPYYPGTGPMYGLVPTDPYPGYPMYGPPVAEPQPQAMMRPPPPYSAHLPRPPAAQIHQASSASMQPVAVQPGGASAFQPVLNAPRALSQKLPGIQHEIQLHVGVGNFIVRTILQLIQTPNISCRFDFHEHRDYIVGLQFLMTLLTEMHSEPELAYIKPNLQKGAANTAIFSLQSPAEKQDMLVFLSRPGLVTAIAEKAEHFCRVQKAMNWFLQLAPPAEEAARQAAHPRQVSEQSAEEDARQAAHPRQVSEQSAEEARQAARPRQVSQQGGTRLFPPLVVAQDRDSSGAPQQRRSHSR
jgi:hypothetical protein